MLVLPDIKAGVIVVDAPLAFATRSCKGEGRSPQHHYGCLSFEQLAAIPVASVAAPGVEALSNGPYLELFARQHWPGWTCVGDEVGTFQREAAQ